MLPSLMPNVLASPRSGHLRASSRREEVHRPHRPKAAEWPTWREGAWPRAKILKTMFLRLALGLALALPHARDHSPTPDRNHSCCNRLESRRA